MFALKNVYPLRKKRDLKKSGPQIYVFINFDWSTLDYLFN